MNKSIPGLLLGEDMLDPAAPGPSCRYIRLSFSFIIEASDYLPTITPADNPTSLIERLFRLNALDKLTEGYVDMPA